MRDTCYRQPLSLVCPFCAAFFSSSRWYAIPAFVSAVYVGVYWLIGAAGGGIAPALLYSPIVAPLLFPGKWRAVCCSLLPWHRLVALGLSLAPLLILVACWLVANLGAFLLLVVGGIYWVKLCFAPRWMNSCFCCSLMLCRVSSVVSCSLLAVVAAINMSGVFCSFPLCFHPFFQPCPPYLHMQGVAGRSFLWSLLVSYFCSALSG